MVGDPGEVPLHFEGCEVGWSGRVSGRKGGGTLDVKGKKGLAK